MFAGLGSNVPRFETRKALVITNMQNDTFERQGELVICEPQDFRDRITAVVPYFRRIGDIVWIRTEIDANVPNPEPSSKTGGEQPGPEQSEDFNETQAATLSLEDRLDEDPLTPFVDEDTIGQYFPSSRAKAAMRKASAKARADQRGVELDNFINDDERDGYIKKPRKGQSASIYRTGSRGAAFTDDTLAVLDDKNDIIITKNHYSAFDTTPLLMSLRMKLITHVYLAGSLSNVSIYATATDAVRHGFDVSVVEDCMGYRSEARHVDAMRKMADMLGVSGVDSEEITEEAGGRIPPDADETMFSGPGLDGIQSRVSGSLPESMPKTLESNIPESALIGARVESEHRRSPEDSASPVGNQPLDVQMQSSGTNMTGSSLGPGDYIGEGDCSIIYHALSDSLAGTAFKLVKNEVDWQAMRHRSGEVPRRVAVQGEVGTNGAVPVYRHPADESPPFVSFTPAVKRIRDELQIRLKQPFNHVLIQLYRNGQDNISEHSDKTLDIVRGSNIVNLSLGARRTMTLRTKKLMHPKREEGESAPRNSQKVPMPHNSVFVLGWRSNAKWLHGVRADKRPESDRTDEEKAFGGERISLTFRHIGTFTNRNRSKIWGQGAVSKFQATAGEVSTSNNSQMEAMIAAFGRENQQVDFDWDAEYGEGFDVMNLVVSGTPRRATLFLCGDETSNLRAKMSVLERGFPCRITQTKPAEAPSRRPSTVRRTIFSLSGDENPLFRDVDASQSETLGDLAILFYISRFYAPEPNPNVSARELHRVDSNLFARITQANELLFLWQQLRGMPLSISTRATHQVRHIQHHGGSTTSPQQSIADERPTEAFEGEMEVWEEYAEESEFVSGEVFTIVDCAFWPVLTEVVRRWEGWSEKRYPNLASYWKKIGAMPSTRQALAEKGDRGEAP